MTEWGLWGAPEWALPALLSFAAALAALLWAYSRAPSSVSVRVVAALLKAAGVAALVLCLVEPLASRVRPRPGQNLFAVVVDASQSMQIRDEPGGQARGETLRPLLRDDSSWLTRLGQHFDVRRFEFDADVHGVQDFASLRFEGDGSGVVAAIRDIARRFRGLPLGGVLLLTDGNATDAMNISVDGSDLPPIHPVVIGSDDVPPDLRVETVSVRQTNFETAPVTIDAEIRSTGADDRQVAVALLDENSREIERQHVAIPAEGESAVAKFQIRPPQAGVNIFRVSTSLAEGEAVSPDEEATEANNSRSVVVENGHGPYRVLYVSGRPNWDFKFLRRALAEDDQLELVGLIRIANREPKFTFRSRRSGDGNPLFEGFHRDDQDTVERHDEPVLTRLGTKDNEELRDGFPQSADELYSYDAIVLDDIEAEFFTQNQLTLIEGFVARRGGGLLMMGGVGAFAQGSYRRTSLGDLLPAYMDESANAQGNLTNERFRLALTRDGWLQDWVRLRKTEEQEHARLNQIPDFQTINAVGRLKPGATELAQVVDSTGVKHAALLAQRFGRGRTAALLIADLWRWGLRRPAVDSDDLEKSWRQTVRWLVADVPRRVEVEAEGVDSTESRESPAATNLRIRVHDAEYLPLDNATVDVIVTTPDSKRLELSAEADGSEPGVYVAGHRSRLPGAYRAEVTVAAPDGSLVGKTETAWVAQPLADEFKRLQPNRAFLAELAAATDGSLVELEDLDRFVESLERQPMPVTETTIDPLWHHPALFLFAVSCLVAEWGLRRWKGLA